MEGIDGEILRRVYPKVLARTLAFTRNLPEAEDAVQEAVVRALASWPMRGTPSSPEAWLLTVATNVHRDRRRKGKWEAPAQDALETLAQMSPWVRMALGDPEVVRGWKDELLRLVFACCHPELEPWEAAALCLATVVGLSVKEIALASITEPRTMEQRLTRARRRMRARGDAEGTAPAEPCGSGQSCVRLGARRGSTGGSDPARCGKYRRIGLSLRAPRSAELGRSEEARDCLIEARRRARNAAEVTQIDSRIASLSTPSDGENEVL